MKYLKSFWVTSADVHFRTWCTTIFSPLQGLVTLYEGHMYPRAQAQIRPSNCPIIFRAGGGTNHIVFALVIMRVAEEGGA